MTAHRRLSSRMATRLARVAQPATGLRALSLRDVCERLAISVRSAERLITGGRFPIPELPNLGLRRHRFSSADVDEYLTRASTTDL